MEDGAAGAAGAAGDPDDEFGTWSEEDERLEDAMLESDGADDGDDEEEDEDEEEDYAKKSKRARSRSTACVGAFRTTAGPRKSCAKPEAAAVRRLQRNTNLFTNGLKKRPDIKLDILNAILISLTGEERARLRGMGAMQQEHYIAARDFGEFLETHCFNALNSIDLRANEALSINTTVAIRNRFACDPLTGKRRVYMRPPHYTGNGNPLTRQSNRACGIKWEHRVILVPFVFVNSNKMASAVDMVLDGRRLHMAYDFDAAAWDLWRTARDLLVQLTAHSNLLTLPAGVLRTLQLRSSRCGAVRFVLRCVDTCGDHNATCNARDPCFFLGTDKHASLWRAMGVGDADGPDRSMRSAMYEGLRVTQVEASSLPEHVRANPLLSALASIR